MIRMLDLSPGASVLEIGTGCGYNTAVLAHLVTASGTITSIDIDPTVVERVEPMIRAAGLRWVRMLCGDGGGGHPIRAPYDRVIAWAAVSEPPAAWRAQLRPRGIAVVPLLATPAVVRRFRNAELGFEPEAEIEGEFVPLTGTPSVM